MQSRNKKINVLICMGTRPEGIKLSLVIKELRKNKDIFDLKICSTGQHRQMLQQVLDFFEIKPDFDMDIMVENQSLGYLSSIILTKMGELFLHQNPDIILIQGDTTTAFFTALAAFYRKIKVGHVEAGLRTGDRYNPFPEEINRQLISRVADLHFAPTKRAYENLLSENISENNIVLTGNTVVDAILWGIEKVKRNSDKIQNREIFKNIGSTDRVILVTMHRRESFGDDIKSVCRALKQIAEKYSSIKIFYPVHLNPNVRRPVFEILNNKENIILTDPLDYESFLWIMQRSFFIITDSGGVQEEAPTLKKPVLVIRKKTERAESVRAGISKLVGIEEQTIIDNIKILLDSKDEYKKMIPKANPYGDGRSAEKIVDFIASLPTDFFSKDETDFY